MANIKNELNNIKSAIYGKDVRSSIHNGIDAINKEVENTTGRQVDLENTFDQLVINAGNSNAEIVDARVKSDGTSYSKLGDRLNEVDSQLAHNVNLINEIEVNVDSFSGDDNEKILQAFEFAKVHDKKISFTKRIYEITKPLSFSFKNSENIFIDFKGATLSFSNGGYLSLNGNELYKTTKLVEDLIMDKTKFKVEDIEGVTEGSLVEIVSPIKINNVPLCQFYLVSDIDFETNEIYIEGRIVEILHNNN